LSLYVTAITNPHDISTTCPWLVFSHIAEPQPSISAQALKVRWKLPQRQGKGNMLKVRCGNALVQLELQA
jgi:hypothetical protein